MKLLSGHSYCCEFKGDNVTELNGLRFTKLIGLILSLIPLFLIFIAFVVACRCC